MLATIRNHLHDLHVDLRLVEGIWVDLETGKAVSPNFQTTSSARRWLQLRYRERGTKVEFAPLMAA